MAEYEVGLPLGCERVELCDGMHNQRVSGRRPEEVPTTGDRLGDREARADRIARDSRKRAVVEAAKSVPLSLEDTAAYLERTGQKTDDLLKAWATLRWQMAIAMCEAMPEDLQ